MIACLSCAAENSDVSKFCSECGAALKPEYLATVAHGVASDALDGSNHASRSGSSHHGRFLPGTNVAGRYRIVSLLGKGGMGEVYRADDLKLGHTVALKFLPPDVSGNPNRLELFHSEVRLTRQIAHPNVCRVYDIGEVDGQHFLSMEFIDGEDLCVLLRRIGRLPPDKGVQIAQQLCAGLAAAHEKGVLHRDLKPANIMLDGRGQVQITDFGLARLVDDDLEGEIAGTPAYMAPEQLLKGEATIQSDLYSLGLILYELFTGKRVYAGHTLRELIRAHEESSLTPPSNVVEDLDPAVERVIQHCLEKQPADRPRSAHAVAAALPGGDPLAAALAAGGTPSPELVAASGEKGTLSLRTGTICLALVLVGLIAYPFVAPFGWLGRHAGSSPGKSEPALMQYELCKEEGILQTLGYYDPDAPPDHSVHGIHLQEQPGLRRFEFWYRQRHGGYLRPTIDQLWTGPKSYVVSLTNPPPFDAGMVSVRVDMRGKLIELLVVADGNLGHPVKNEEALFERSGYKLQDFEKITEPDEPRPEWTPPVYADRTAVYRPKSSADPNVWVFTAHHDDRLVYFFAGPVSDGRPVGRWFVPTSRQPRTVGRLYMLSTTLQTIRMIALLAAIFLALRNLRLARVDRKGALRIAIVYGALQFLLWVFAYQHVPSLERELPLLVEYLNQWIVSVFRVWLLYIALEPYVRRYWPDVLVAWSRALNGRFRDPLLGRELLMGCAIAVVAVLLVAGVNSVAQLSDAPARISQDFDPGSNLRLTASALHASSRSLVTSIWTLMILFLFRVACRDTRLTVAAFVLFWMGTHVLIQSPIFFMVGVGIVMGGLALVITRFGLAAGAAYWFGYYTLTMFLITPDVTTWYGRGTLVALGSIAAVALHGFYTSTLAPLRLRHQAT